MPGEASFLMPGTAGGPAVRLFWLDDDRDVALDLAWSFLAPEERARAERFHFDHDRRRYIRGRGFLRGVLGARLGLPAGAVTFVTGPWQKPFVTGGPEFNLSHSGPWAALALSDSGPVGIDVECVDRHGEIERVAESCFVAAELDALRRAEEGDRRRQFFAFWTAKEALMKMTGQGMSLAPREIELALRDGWPCGYARPSLAGAELQFVETGQAGLVCCLARQVGH